MKIDSKYILKYVIAFVSGIILFNIMLFFVSLIPSEMLEEHVIESANILYENGPYYKVSEWFDVYDNTWTDSVVVNEIYSMDNKHPYESYMKVRKNYKEGQTKEECFESLGEGITANYSIEDEKEYVDGTYDSIGELADFLNGMIETSLTYGRYWHGYLLLYRPLFLFFNISQVRMFQLVLLCGLFISLAYLINKKIGLLPAVIYTASLICCGYITVSYSLESCSIFIITMIASIVLLFNIEKIKDIYFYLFIVGMVANYVDYLTVPLIAVGIPLSLWLLYKSKTESMEKAFITVIVRIDSLVFRICAYLDFQMDTI